MTMSDKNYCNNKNHLCKINNRSVQLTNSLSPSSRSYCSSPSTSSPSSPSPNSTTKGSMEGVWKEITLSSFHDHSTTNITNITTTTTDTATATDLARSPLQDFMPLGASPSNTLSTNPSSMARIIIDENTDGDINTAAAMLRKACRPFASRLNSWSNFLGHGVGPSVPFGPPFGSHYNSELFETLDASSGFTITRKKRIFENGSDCDDKRHKRLMKNRESASRSRARKQAHTSELEVEVIRLQAENARLRREVQQSLAAPAQLPKKRSLRRALTAPL